ncbi:lipopolysaccharide biosynthesis protein [Arthrobacter ginkgonis]|uniref:lipopolysaccharide biosynthesis protein n=1 Tax=Arthrobacter ginkgonis TaxID=1630594 RepID=UPI0031E6EB7D
MVYGVLALVSIPVLMGAVGAAAWGHIVLCQTVGVWASIVISFGWDLTGPAEVSQAHPGTLAARVARSLYVRFALLCFAVLVFMVVLWIIGAGRDALVFGLAFLSTAVLGMRCNWVFVGLSRPGMMQLLETLPRTMPTLVGIILTAHLKQPEWILIGSTVGLFLAIGVTQVWVSRDSDGSSVKSIGGIRSVIRKNIHGLGNSVIGVTYATAAIPIVAIVAPQSLPLFALVDKTLKQANTAFSPLFDFFRSKAVSNGRPSARSSLRVVNQSCVIALACALIFLAFSEPFFKWISLGMLEVPFVVALGLAVLFVLGIQTTMLVQCGLAPLGILGQSTRISGIISFLGLGACAVLAWQFGALGGICGLALGYAVRSATARWQIGQTRRRARHAGPSPRARGRLRRVDCGAGPTLDRKSETEFSVPADGKGVPIAAAEPLSDFDRILGQQISAPDR